MSNVKYEREDKRDVKREVKRVVKRDVKQMRRCHIPVVPPRDRVPTGQFLKYLIKSR